MTEDETTRLLTQLWDKHEGIRESAVAFACQLPDEELLDLVTAHIQRPRQIPVRLRTQSSASLLSLFLVGCSMSLAHGHFGIEVWGWLLSLSLMLAIPVFFAELGRRTPLDRRVLNSVGNIADPMLIGRLLDLIRQSRFASTNLRLHDALRQALKQTLQVSEPRDLQQLTLFQRESLRNLLQTPNYDPELTFALLHAVEDTNDLTALTLVRQIAEGRGMTMDKTILRAAAHCREHLEAQQAKARQGQQLLRPSQSTTPKNTLLRPTLETIAPAAQLLRAGNRVESDEQTEETAP